MKFLNPASYQGIRSPNQITFTKQARSGRLCGDYMVEKAPGEFSFYRTCGQNEEQIRQSANEIKQNFSGSDGLEGAKKGLQEDIIAGQASLERKKLQLSSQMEALQDETDPTARDALSQYISGLQGDIQYLERELQEDKSSLSKVQAANAEVRQR